MRRAATGLTLLMIAGLVVSAPAAAQEVVPVTDLPRQTHVHGLAVDPVDASFLFIATHHGFYRVGPDGLAERISIVQDFMGFTPHPTAIGTMFASGHPANGGNLGLIVSNDGGRTWAQRSPGANGPVDFHMMALSRADPDVIYGVFGALQRSVDGGFTWRIVGSLPAQTVDLAASSIDPNTLYAAAVGGLFKSEDAGATWTTLFEGAPVSLVEVGPNGELYAFALGRGLLFSAFEGGDLETIVTNLGQRYLSHLAIGDTDNQKLFAADQFNEVLVSNDGGRTWRSFGR